MTVQARLLSLAITPAMLKALRKAAARDRGNICPTIGVHAVASDVLVAALDRAGFVQWDGKPWHSAPRINDAGRAAVACPQTPPERTT